MRQLAFSSVLGPLTDQRGYSLPCKGPRISYHKAQERQDCRHVAEKDYLILFLSMPHHQLSRQSQCSRWPSPENRLVVSSMPHGPQNFISPKLTRASTPYLGTTDQSPHASHKWMLLACPLISQGSMVYPSFKTEK